MREDQRLEFEKSYVLSKLKENERVHRETYEDALKNWHQKMLTDLRRLAREFKKATPKDSLDINLYNQLISENTQPRSYLTEYEIAIEWIENSVDEKILLTQSQFRQYIKDNWEWTDEFIVANAKYTTKYFKV